MALSTTRINPGAVVGPYAGRARAGVGTDAPAGLERARALFASGRRRGRRARWTGRGSPTPFNHALFGSSALRIVVAAGREQQTEGHDQ